MTTDRTAADLEVANLDALLELRDLVDLNAIATRLDVPYGTLAQWRHRGQFIDPDLELSIGPIWAWRRVRTWAIATGRLDP